MRHFRSFVFLILLISCSLYSYWLSNKDFEWVIPYMEERSPAAVRESRDFQALLEKPLRVFKRDALAGSIEVIARDGKYKFTMGQYAVEGNKGPNLMCLEYPFVKVRLQGEGVAVGGKKAELWVVAPCKTHPKNQDMMSDIELPFDEMYRGPAQDRQWEMQQEHFTTQVYLRNVFGNWPKQWLLESVQFLRDKNDLDSPEKIDNQEILLKKGGPILIRVVK